MKPILFLSLILSLAAFNVAAKAVTTLNKDSSICSVAFQSNQSSKRTEGKKYLRFKIQDIRLSDLNMVKGSLESPVSSQWLNTGKHYYISAYINNTIGLKHIFLIISENQKTAAATWMSV